MKKFKIVTEFILAFTKSNLFLVFNLLNNSALEISEETDDLFNTHIPNKNKLNTDNFEETSTNSHINRKEDDEHRENDQGDNTGSATLNIIKNKQSVKFRISDVANNEDEISAQQDSETVEEFFDCCSSESTNNNQIGHNNSYKISQNGTSRFDKDKKSKNNVINSTKEDRNHLKNSNNVPTIDNGMLYDTSNRVQRIENDFLDKGYLRIFNLGLFFSKDYTLEILCGIMKYLLNLNLKFTYWFSGYRAPANTVKAITKIISREPEVKKKKKRKIENENKNKNNFIFDNNKNRIIVEEPDEWEEIKDTSDDDKSLNLFLKKVSSMYSLCKFGIEFFYGYIKFFIKDTFAEKVLLDIISGTQEKKTEGGNDLKRTYSTTGMNTEKIVKISNEYPDHSMLNDDDFDLDTSDENQDDIINLNVNENSTKVLSVNHQHEKYKFGFVVFLLTSLSNITIFIIIVKLYFKKSK